MSYCRISRLHFVCQNAAGILHLENAKRLQNPNEAKMLFKYFYTIWKPAFNRVIKVQTSIGYLFEKTIKIFSCSLKLKRFNFVLQHCDFLRVFDFSSLIRCLVLADINNDEDNVWMVKKLGCLLFEKIVARWQKREDSDFKVLSKTIFRHMSE